MIPAEAAAEDARRSSSSIASVQFLQDLPAAESAAESPENASELVATFLAAWSDRVAMLRRAGVLLPLWRWWLRCRLLGVDHSQQGDLDDEAIHAGCLAWALERWEPSLEREFLARQDRYHLLRYSQLRVDSKDLAHELGFRLREREADFPELNFRYGKPPERKRGGLMPDRPLSALPAGVASLLLGLTPGQVAGPLRQGQEFVLLRLEASAPAVLDDAMRERLLKDLFEEWLGLGDAALLAALDSEGPVTSTDAG